MKHRYLSFINMTNTSRQEVDENGETQKITCGRVRANLAIVSDFISRFRTQATSTIATMLPDELLDQLTQNFPCREAQVQQLAALYSVNRP
jgi:hypothetical protein